MTKKPKQLRPGSGILGAVGEVFFAVRRWATRVIKERGIDLTFEQIMVLMVLEDVDGVGLGDLSEIIDREKTTITRMVDGLERLKLVVRIASDKDRRKKLLYLTSTGRKKIVKLQEFRPKILSESTKGIKKKDLKIAEEVLNKVFDNLVRE